MFVSFRIGTPSTGKAYSDNFTFFAIYVHWPVFAPISDIIQIFLNCLAILLRELVACITYDLRVIFKTLALSSSIIRWIIDEDCKE